MAFPTSSLTNNQVHKEGSRAFVYDSALGVWDQVRETDAPDFRYANIQAGEIGSVVTGGSGLDDLPNKHNKCISRATFSGFNSTGVNPIDNSWVITNIGNSDEVMTQSSGIFTFPSNGVWRFQLRASAYNSTAVAFTAESVGIDGYLSTDSGTNWTHKFAGVNHLDFPANDWYRVPIFSEFIFDITNASTTRLKFSCGTNPACNVHWGGGTENGSCWFIKLGET